MTTLFVHNQNCCVTDLQLAATVFNPKIQKFAIEGVF